MKFSLVIPVYNEAPVITPTLLLLGGELTEKLGDDWEIIVVDNASTDATTEKAKALLHPQIKVLRLLEKGKGHALRSGFTHAKGEVIGFTDADLPIDPKEIIAAHSLLVSSSDAVLLGSRFHPNSTMPGREWWRIGSSHVFNILARTIVGVSVRDTQCPLKLVKRSHLDVFLATTEPTWFFDLEFIAILERLKLPVTQISVTWDEHRYPARRSKLSGLDGFRSLPAMLRIRKNLPKQVKQLSLFQETK